MCQWKCDQDKRRKDNENRGTHCSCDNDLVLWVDVNNEIMRRGLQRVDRRWMNLNKWGTPLDQTELPHSFTYSHFSFFRIGCSCGRWWCEWLWLTNVAWCHQFLDWTLNESSHPCWIDVTNVRMIGARRVSMKRHCLKIYLILTTNRIRYCFNSFWNGKWTAAAEE